MRGSGAGFIKRTVSKFMNASGYIDFPPEGTAVYPDSISISGWVYAANGDVSRCRVGAWIGSELIGETSVFYVRADVCAALNLPATTATGFHLLGYAAAPGTETLAPIKISATWDSDSDEYEIGQRTVRLQPRSLGKQPYEEELHPTQPRVLHRNDIYGSGPPLEEPGPEALSLIRQRLGPGSSVVDVGCGAGAYGPALIADGHEWLGIELNPVCLEILARRKLPFRALARSPDPLPLRDGEFEDALCIEVLEHIENTDAFLREVARVVRRRALFSVPNLEVIPRFSASQVVPWHLLEGDHKNFFTRASLRELLQKHFRRVEVFSFCPHPLRTPDGIALHLHLFAVAEK